MSNQIDLRERQNRRPGAKDEITVDGLYKNIFSVLDNLALRDVGEWAYEKIFYLVQYFGIYASGMKNAWNGLNYVEICSGPGRCLLREDGREIDGTALAIARHKDFEQLRKALFVDASSTVVALLNQRLAAVGASPRGMARKGNYHDTSAVRKLLSELPDGCLNLVFIDPTECNVPFTTIQAIVDQLKNADLLINVAIGTDVNRNLVAAVLDPAFDKAREKYESFLGMDGFCDRPDVVELAKRRDYDDLRRLFAETYHQQLRGLGYQFTDVRPVRHYYHLLFASRHEKGLEFWKKACRIGPDDQREMIF